MNTPILFLIYNRPDPTRVVFEQIRRAKPPRLYVSADGPRDDQPTDRTRCAQAREIATAVDWSCEVKTLFSDSNLGCKLGEATGMNWFFSEEIEGIVVEDDTLPTMSFFRFCEELLERYRYDDAIGMISGSSFVSKYWQPQASYYFSRLPHTWGWAGWQRAWKSYDVTMHDWAEIRATDWLDQIGEGDRAFVRCWRQVFEDAYAGRIDSWDYQWIYSLWKQGQLCIVPRHNLITNIGFGPDATHTTGVEPRYVKDASAREIDFPLRHPRVITRAKEAERAVVRKVWKITTMSMLRRRLMSTAVARCMKPMLTRILRRADA